MESNMNVIPTVFSFFKYLSKENTICRNPYADLENYNLSKILSLKDKLSKNKVSLSKNLNELKVRTTHYDKLLPCILSSYCTSSSVFPLYRYLLPTLIRTDWLSLVDWNGFYRDHIVHQSLTAYIVETLLSEESVFSKSINDIAKDLSQFKCLPFVKEYLKSQNLPEKSPWLTGGEMAKILWRDLFIKTSITAAIFHDLGYLWQHQNSENSLIGDFTHPVLCSSILEKTKKIFIDYPFLAYVINGYSYNSKCIAGMTNGLSQLKCMFGCCAFENNKTENNRMDRFCGRVESMYSKTHGLPGALNFLHLHDGFKKNNACVHPINKLSLEWAASAIAMHDMKKMYWGKGSIKPDVPNLRIDAEKDPISAIVTFADTLQEFERHIAYFFKSNTNLAEENNCNTGTSNKVCLKFDSSCSSTMLEFTKEDSALNITYKMRNWSGYSHKINDIKKDTKKLFHPSYGFLGLSSWGIDKVTMEAVYEPDDKKPDKKD